MQANDRPSDYGDRPNETVPRTEEGGIVTTDPVHTFVPFPCQTSQEPFCGDCPECRQAPITEAELDRLRHERDHLRAALRGLIRGMQEVVGPQREAIRVLASIAGREEEAKVDV